MEERPVAAFLILASVIALGHAAAAPLLADDRRREYNRLSHFSSGPYLSPRPLQPGLHRFFSHPSPPPPPPSSRPFRRWPPQRHVGRGSKRRPPPPLTPSKRAKRGTGGRLQPPPPPRLKPFHPAYRRAPVGRRYGGGSRKLNVGRKIGFLFMGVVVLLQVALGVFLSVRRWQISKLERRSS